MLVIENTRFGRIEVDPGAIIHFPVGLVGFPEQTSFVLLEREEGRLIAYLQSVGTPELAFPVADGVMFGAEYPQPGVSTLAAQHSFTGDDIALIVVLAVNPETKNLEANLLAPILVDVEARRGVQVVLDARKYSAAVPLALTEKQSRDPDPVAEAKRRIAAIRARTHAPPVERRATAEKTATPARP
ncbi:MAG: flagellar assembly protein FliW [Myxococcota bacterium]